MPSTGEAKKEQMRVHSRTPESKALRATRQAKYKALAKHGDPDESLQIDPQALLAALSNWKQI